ncbi:hypothetical protein GCM10027186_53260 [Micromonospora schwarzwaldensis]
MLGLSATVAAMAAVRRIANYHQAKAPVTEPVTKFGGQPVWLTGSQWPVSQGWGTPMRFVCQIALEPEFAGAGPGRLAYVFVTHGDHGSDVEDFDPDVILPDGGENAVIIQPGGVFDGPTSPLTSGPTLYHRDGSPAEYTVELIRGEDPEHLPYDAYMALPPDERDRYFQALDQDKIGGTALMLNEHDWPTSGPWRPLLRLETNWKPFYLNLGAAPVAFAFISTDGRHGCFLVQDS